MRVLIVENGYSDLKKSRLPLGEYLVNEGYTVIYACPEPRNIHVHNIPMSRNSILPRDVIKGVHLLKSLEKDNNVDIIVSFRFIPNLLNYLASLINCKPKRFIVITGLGHAFVATNTSLKTKIQRSLIKLFYKFASNRVEIVAQNPDDLNDLGVNGKIINGSGVNKGGISDGYEVVTTSLKMLYVGRLLRAKGILTALKIFDEVRKVNQSASLTIAGEIDLHNPDSISNEELSSIKTREGVKYLGFVEDINKVYCKCNVLIFPSIYREGVPRAIIEALKFGLTIITTDMPGCKETISGNGLITNDPKSAVEYLLGLTPIIIENNAIKSRALFESKFESKVVYSAIKKIIE